MTILEVKARIKQILNIPMNPRVYNVRNGMDYNELNITLIGDNTPSTKILINRTSYPEYEDTFDITVKDIRTTHFYNLMIYSETLEDGYVDLKLIR